MHLQPRTNWAGNVTFGAPGFHRPATIPELQAAVSTASRIRVLASGHSFNDLADSPGAQVSLAGLPPEVSVDSAARVARVAAGLSQSTQEDLRARYERLPDFLGLMRRLDPSGKFRNAYTDRYLGR